ncbi:MAG: hypothetical protein PHY41_07830, partial [Candidatus Cloacimonetes bacterium]|nr:hypothetical protein [Candidatus Cloacimonadota bacterium]
AEIKKQALLFGAIVAFLVVFFAITVMQTSFLILYRRVKVSLGYHHPADKGESRGKPTLCIA